MRTHNPPATCRVCWRPHAEADDPEVLALLEAANRLTVLSERLLRRAELQLTGQEADDARRELDTTRAALTQLDALITLRRQQLRTM